MKHVYRFSPDTDVLPVLGTTILTLRLQSYNISERFSGLLLLYRTISLMRFYHELQRITSRSSGICHHVPLSTCIFCSRNDGCRWSTAGYATAAAGGLGGLSFRPSPGTVGTYTSRCHARQDRCKQCSHEGCQPAPTNASVPNDGQR